MENAIETIERGGFTSNIYYDTDTIYHAVHTA